jgi:hypothetical protein
VRRDVPFAATLWQLALLLPPLADDELGLGATEGLRERGAQHGLIVRREHASRQFARGHPFLRTAILRGRTHRVPIRRRTG